MNIISSMRAEIIFRFIDIYSVPRKVMTYIRCYEVFVE